MTNAAKTSTTILKHGSGGDGGSGSINALALLATGNTNYLPMLQTFARSLAPTNHDLEATAGFPREISTIASSWRNIIC